jgi:hypothetical protein
MQIISDNHQVVTKPSHVNRSELHREQRKCTVKVVDWIVTAQRDVSESWPAQAALGERVQKGEGTVDNRISLPDLAVTDRAVRSLRNWKLE